MGDGFGTGTGSIHIGERAMSLEPTILQEVLGYLNFSSGKPDPRLLGNLNALYQSAEDTAADGQATEPTIQSVRKQLQAKLDTLAGAPGAFENVEQIFAVLPLVFDLLPAAYRRFHRDLLFHESDAEIWRPFFCACLRGGLGPGIALGRNRTHSRRRDCAVERLCRPSPGGGAAHVTTHRTLPARMAAAGALVRARGGRGLRTSRRDRNAGTRDPARRRIRPYCAKRSSIRRVSTSWPSIRGPTTSIIR